MSKETELTAEEIAAITKEAEAEVAKEAKAKAKKELKDRLKAELTAQALFSVGKDEDGEDTELVTIHLGEGAATVTLDGRIYQHGRTVRVKKATAATLKDIMYRTHLHEYMMTHKDMKGWYGAKRYDRRIGEVA